jgi:septal ring factor EnvC (AmiA/AmiB activator)
MNRQSPIAHPNTLRPRASILNLSFGILPFTFYILSSAFCLLPFLSGCSRSSAQSPDDMISKARLISVENTRLKKELADKDAQIQDLEKRVEALETENNEFKKDAKDIETLMQSLMELSTKSEQYNEQLMAENQALKDQLQKLKN